MTDPWHPLRRLTAARIALGRAGGSVPTRALLDFRAAHANARDAVLREFDSAALAARLRLLGLAVVCLKSGARNRAEYLRRPDLGRRLLAASRDELSSSKANGGCDLAIIVSDGLSSNAAMTQVEPLLSTFVPLARKSTWSLAPLVVVSQGRVALQDEIGALLGARLTLMLLGERPGLGAVDSLGAYFTYGPRLGLTDTNRNCVSNIRAGGLPPVEAAHKLFELLTESFRRGLSGVALKDDAPTYPSLPGSATGNVLPAASQ